jgi:hypothetical protein
VTQPRQGNAGKLPPQQQTVPGPSYDNPNADDIHQVVNLGEDDYATEDNTRPDEDD